MRGNGAVLSVLLLGAALMALTSGCGRPPSGGGPGVGKLEKVPDLTLADLSGSQVRLGQFDGKVRLIDFWATWCAPCREEIPSFKDLHARYGERGLAIIAISMDEEGAKVVKPFVEDQKIPYVNLLGNEEVAEAFGGIVGYPTAFLVDREGRVVATYVGGTPKRIFEAKIKELLGDASAS